MARTRTLTQLMADVRQRADMENDPHITDAEVTRHINQSCAALHALIVETDETYFLQILNLSTTRNVETVSITDTAFYKLLHIEATISGIVFPLERWTFERRTLYKNAATWGLTQFPISYRLSIAADGTAAVYFAPVPDGIYPITLTYVRAFNDLVSGSDTFNGMDGWEEWVVLDAAIKCLTKEESSISDLSAERDRVWARIASQLATPDRDRPDVTRDVLLNGQHRRYQVYS